MLVHAVAFAMQGFWMLMLFDWVRTEPREYSWLWLLIMLNFPGAVIYFVARKLPYMDLPIPNFFKRWTMQTALHNAEAGVHNIGKSYQYVTLGNVLLEMGDLDRALTAYQEALSREANNSHALWGCATIEVQQQKLDSAQEHLEILLAKEPDFKRGDASLLYGKVLFDREYRAQAKEHLELDLKQWGHAEAYLLLAKIAIYDCDISTARTYLETMLARVKAAPQYNYRMKQHLVREAEKLLKKLPSFS
jgi:hypothetical protein